MRCNAFSIVVQFNVLRPLRGGISRNISTRSNPPNINAIMIRSAAFLDAHPSPNRFLESPMPHRPANPQACQEIFGLFFVLLKKKASATKQLAFLKRN
jgi:hypothetical protein